jgi:hypothetical protein
MFEVTFGSVVEATVTHTDPCVPECPVCYPPTEESEG